MSQTASAHWSSAGAGDDREHPGRPDPAQRERQHLGEAEDE